MVTQPLLICPKCSLGNTQTYLYLIVNKKHCKIVELPSDNNCQPGLTRVNKCQPWSTKGNQGQLRSTKVNQSQSRVSQSTKAIQHHPTSAYCVALNAQGFTLSFLQHCTRDTIYTRDIRFIRNISYTRGTRYIKRQ